MFRSVHKNFSVDVDFIKGSISSLCLDGRERIVERLPIFKLGIRDTDGTKTVVSAFDAKVSSEAGNKGVYSDFCGRNVEVTVTLNDNNGDAEWRISANVNDGELLLEWVEFPILSLPALRENNDSGTGGDILFPYNEGALVSNLECRENSPFKYCEPEYPSKGSYAIFPNMICSQMLGYIWDDAGLYVGIHDPSRGVKAIDFYGEGDGVTLQIRIYCGVERGASYSPEFPIVWSAVEGSWEAVAERYRAWFETDLPPKVKRIAENTDLPEWYKDSPLVISYPVRGRFDADEMTPNSFYPYTNALPIIREIKNKVDSRLLVLLMHWEGSAPWAPPYVWPPFGGTENFFEFMSELHKNKDLLGVYCSGFGYTIQSNLIKEYNRQKEYEERNLVEAMCAAPDGKIEISRICTAQRSGYDICPASQLGREVLNEAYMPLFESGVDYAQILDQNHGGGQYFCYGRDHGHPPAPGAWMTENMQNMLSEWNEAAGRMLLGCESAASEAFMGNLLFSDNRFELNYYIGKPVPLYAYIYHEYIRNFMGNQVSCPFLPDDDTLGYRIAYSFAIGDCMTIVLSPNGDIMPAWGRPRYTKAPDKEKLLTLISNLTRFYKERGRAYLFDGRMMPCKDVTCPSVSYECRNAPHRVNLPSVVFSAWENSDGKKAYILVNPNESSIECNVCGRCVSVPPLDAVLIEE